MTDDRIGELLADHPLTVVVPVAWGDMDAMGHVNNAVHFRWFETARIEAFGSVGLGSPKESNGIGPILHSASCRYRIPLTHPDTVTVGTQIGDVGDDRFVMHHRTVSHRHGAVAADGESTVVTFDYASGRKAPLPGDLRERLLALRRG